MPTEVIMPKVDMDMASGKILTWHVGEGERVAKGDPLFDIETDKAAMEVEAPADGLLHHTAPEGMEIPIGTPCAWLYADGEEVRSQPRPFGGTESAGEPPATPDRPAEVPPESVAGPPEPAPGEAAEATPEERPLSDPSAAGVRATPRARALAGRAGLDMSAVAGSGPRGRVQADDVRRALQAAAPAPSAFRPETGALAVSRGKSGTGTPVVLIHGFASDATSWAPVEAHLKHRPLIRIELPGHGKSPKLGIDGFADLVREMRRAFDGLGTEKVHMVGHSLGGALAIALADTRPRRLASLSLISPAGLGPEINGNVLAGICKATRAESLGPWLRCLVANEDIVTDSYVRLAMAARAEPNQRAAQTSLADALFPDGVQAFDLRAALDRIETPTRIIWGKRDAIIPWQHALRAPGRMALHLFDGIGHMPQIECADAVGSIIKADV